VRLHATLLLLPLITYGSMPVEGVLGVAFWVGLNVLLFGSVLLHELGHALTARRYGIQTQDIVLTPLGGMARITSLPTNPRHEIVIALAGPAVSLLLAAGAFALSAVMIVVPGGVPRVCFEAFGLLLYINLMLGLFNLVPALPMDGGRVLRGYLALKRDHLSATRIAARVGRYLAVAGGLYGFLFTDSWTLPLIAVFVYMSAGAEERMAAYRAYREQAARQRDPFIGWPFGAPRPGSGPAPRADGARVYRWDWSNGPRSDAPPPASDDDWSRADDSGRREVLTVGGKAEVIARKDPD